jgi:indole-3-acetate monooxygenase
MDTLDIGRTAPFLKSLRRLAPLIAETRERFDRERRLPNEVFSALAEAGLFRLFLPRSLGGPELTPIEFMTVVEAAAALDGSVGWLVGNGGGYSRAGGYLPHHVGRSWFADPHAFVTAATGAIGTAERVEAGYRVNGRWPFGSGAYHASHFMGLACGKDAQDRDEAPLCVYFKRNQVLVHDTWHVSGLRGTGSCDFEVKGIVVPHELVHPLVDYVPTSPGVVYRLPTHSIFPWTVAVVPLGIAKGAMDAFAAIACTKSAAGSGGLLRERDSVQNMFGRAEARLHAGQAFLVAAMNALIAAIDVGGDELIRARAAFRAAGAHAAETAIDVVGMLASAAAASSIFESNPIERAIRDVHAATKHVAMSPNIFSVAGRIALGLDAGVARF